MFKERVKTSIIIVLLLNLVFLTYQMWFKSGMLGLDWPYISFSELPLVRMFARDNSVSVPKENLSKPRKIVINDGSLWVPYYNTDDAFNNLDERTSEIIRGLLSGKRKSEREIAYEKWLDYLASPSVYVEYPIAVAPKMLSMVLNSSYERMPADISIIKDAIIIPAGEKGVNVAIRDANTNKAREFYIEDENLAFPVEVLAMYAEKYQGDGYYEFAFNTLLSDGMGTGNVTVDDLVLFSDNESTYHDIMAKNPLINNSYEGILKSFSFNPKPLRHYSDDYGAENYVENYATLRIFSDGYIEYSAVDADKGIDLGKDEDNQYEILNAAIDFAEKVWKGVSDEPLSVLVSGVEETENGNKFIFDYYYGGREVVIGNEKDGRDPLYHGIEIVTEGARIVSYRQYLRSYEESVSQTTQENFIPALDYFVGLFNETPDSTITDLYPGYYDSGENNAVLKTVWLCEINYGDERYPKQ